LKDNVSADFDNYNSVIYISTCRIPVQSYVTII